MMGLLIILLVIVIGVIILWAIESRVFLLLYQKLFYRTDKEALFPENITRYFPEHQLLKKNLTIIQKELIVLMQEYQRIPKLHELDNQNRRISFKDGPGWRTFYMKAYNGWFIDNCRRCPNTYSLIRQMDNVLTAMFSIMEPGNEIPAHTGKFFGFLRYQMPLIVPKKGHCMITVGDKTHQYKEGQAILFDDTIEHSVVNATDEMRIVLFLDIDKRANFLVSLMNRFFMWLVIVSPKFKNGETKAYGK
ncbi:aspartyl/asparaginyl beta-hydroxylase domain-containing protein [Fulvivirgaceae bacterium BMA10]|uniref:Aspartyl/asparaginyl beta-hydroxylase domain-containing protein n=1 Tax=Splendidivirga corallicola TaxID=3051826 RepID=A0ABT8KNY7_9BACT|nr:aspartyl/asparaginyl beta-hydroxylase domain-containing protein [Fulvivirgaceae bacterium BMA10]